MKKNALIILERPWNMHPEDQNTTSVLPFFQGLQKLRDNFDLFQTNFYEVRSFELALDELTQLDYDRYYLYIASHGKGRRLENINLSNAFSIINKKAQSKNIIGVLIGSCLVGKNIADFQAYTEASSIVWKVGYKCAVDWLDGTVLDVKLFDELIDIKPKELKSRDKLIHKFRHALCNYQPYGCIGTNNKNKDMFIKDSLSVVIQPQGQGQKAMDCSDQLFDQDEN